MKQVPVPKEKRGRSHGTAGKYAECKCDVCTDYNTQRNRIAREKRLAKPIPADVVHGPSTFRNWDCHCTVCLNGNRELLRERTQAAGPGVNRRKEWTADELKVATATKDGGRRYVQTALEVAITLGRSVAAVNKQRTGVKVNPDKIINAPGGEQ
jgi:hypothetical protein